MGKLRIKLYIKRCFILYSPIKRAAKEGCQIRHELSASLTDVVKIFSGSPFSEGSPHVFNGGQCFYADVREGFKIKDAGCHLEYPFVCEIKKKHRTSPDEISAEI